MANEKELEIKLKATGGAQAAAEVEKVEDAVSDLDKQTEKTSGMTPMFEWGEPIDHAAKKTETLTDAVTDLGTTAKETETPLDDLTDAANDMSGSFNMGGQAASVGLGSRLLALAGGPVAVIITAFTLSWNAAKKLTEWLDKIAAAGARTLPPLARTNQEAAVAAAELADKEALVAEALKQGETNADAYAKRLRSLADQQAALTDAELGADLAQIDLDELTGALTEAEAIEARFAAKRAADDRKRAAEKVAIETELNNQRQQNALAQSDLNKTAQPTMDAKAELDRLKGQGASTVPALEKEAAARNAALKARADTDSIDPAELDALDKAVTEAQDALTEAYEKLVAEKLKQFQDLRDKSRAAADRLSEGRAKENAISRELDNFTAGPGAQTDAANRRAEDLRLEAERVKLQQSQAKAQADAEAKSRQAGQDTQAQALAGEIQSKVSGAANPTANPELLASLKAIAATLNNGTNDAELASISSQLATRLESLSAEQTANRALIANLKSRIDGMR